MTYISRSSDFALYLENFLIYEPHTSGLWLCWGLSSQSTIFQSCRDGAIASWVINQYFRGVKCLAQGHNTAAVGFEPSTSRSGVRHSTTEPPRSPFQDYESVWHNIRPQKYRSQWPTFLLRPTVGPYWLIILKYEVHTANSFQDIWQNHWAMKFRSQRPTFILR